MASLPAPACLIYSGFSMSTTGELFERAVSITKRHTACYVESTGYQGHSGGLSGVLCSEWALICKAYAMSMQRKREVRAQARVKTAHYRIFRPIRLHWTAVVMRSGGIVFHPGSQKIFYCASLSQCY